ncbi:hypothetical protein ENTCAN_07260 [Enterobacter cancerogenus ATCC 35316]|nr:hypothetical protein ENTCAN_07260 [Enterobacter cancerogenus ATCC 35316]
MSAVMMTQINAPKIRVPEKGAGVRRLLVQTVAVAPPAMTEITAAMTANVTIANAMTVHAAIVHVMTALATIVRVMTIRVIMPHRGVPSRARLAKRRQRKPITAGSAAKALSIRKFCAASVQKRPASMAKTPVRPCSRAALSASSAPGSSRA